MPGTPQTLQVPPPVSVQTILYNTYLQIIGGGNTPFVGPLDALIAQGATFLHASSVRRLSSSYTGPACRLRGNGASVEADIAFLPDGTLDLAAATAVAADSGGTLATWVTAYDQTGAANATQVLTGSQPLFSSAIESRGAMQGTGSSRHLDVNLGVLPNPSFVCFVVNIANTTGTRTLLGTSASASAYARLTVDTTQQTWSGTAVLGGSSVIAPGKHLFGFLVNSTSSANYVGGLLDSTGDTGNTLLNMSAARLGRSVTTTTSFFTTNNNTISEVIVFNGDPTLLAGWPAFVAAQKAYFGIP
jgi:hypothetical protein